MCIFLASREHPDYALVVLSNRDEFIDRETQQAHWWPNTAIYAPKDLRRGGTWMGVSRTGRLAVLVNFHEVQPVGALSRGHLPISFLSSKLDPEQWAAETLTTHAEALELAGGFTMLYGNVVPDSKGSISHLQTLSNRQPPAHLLTDDKPTLSMSNGPLSDKSWTKTESLRQAFEPLKQLSGQNFVDACFALLSISSVDETVDLSSVRTTVFVPRCELPTGPYATRTQTIVLISHDGQVTYLEKNLGSHAGNPKAIVEPIIEQFAIVK